MTAYGYAYPWDLLGDPGAADRMAATGVDAVALAAAYHSVRASTPHHPAHRMVVAAHAALYLPVRASAWQGSRLRPAGPGWVAEPDPFGEAAARLRGAGLGVHAWMALTHNTRLGSANPDLVVRNAFGDGYEYALCPSAEHVRAYCSTLVAEVLDQADVDGLVIEACGPLGVVHGGHHDKTDLAHWSATQQALLSLCLCGACEDRYAQAGLDPVELARRVRHGVDREAATVEDALGAVADVVRQVRLAASGDLREALVAQIRGSHPDRRITLHAGHDAWATGPFSPLDGPVPGVDAVVAACWDLEGAPASLAALRAVTGDGASLGAYLRPDLVLAAGLPADEVLTRLRAAGLDELHLYHLGMSSGPALGLLAELVGQLVGQAPDQA